MRPVVRYSLLSVLVLALGCSAFGGKSSANAARTSPSNAKKTEVRSVTLHIDLQDGFQNDEVIVRLDGKQVFHKSGVSTDIRISRADGFEAPSAKPQSTIDIELPKKHLKATQSFAPSGTAHVGVSIREGKPQFRLSAEPFLYM
jgi:hypothetical protein